MAEIAELEAGQEVVELIEPTIPVIRAPEPGIVVLPGQAVEPAQPVKPTIPGIRGPEPGTVVLPGQAVKPIEPVEPTIPAIRAAEPGTVVLPGQVPLPTKILPKRVITKRVLTDAERRLNAITNAKNASLFFSTTGGVQRVWSKRGDQHNLYKISDKPIGLYTYSGYKIPATVDQFIAIWNKRTTYTTENHLTKKYIEDREKNVAIWPYQLSSDMKTNINTGAMLMDVYNIERDIIIESFTRLNKYLHATYDELYTIFWTEVVLQVAYGGSKTSIFSAQNVDPLVLSASVEELRQVVGPEFTNKYSSTKADILLAIYFKYTPPLIDAFDMDRANDYLIVDTTQQKIALISQFIYNKWEMPPHRILGGMGDRPQLYPFVLQLPLRDIATDQLDISTYAQYGESLGLQYPPGMQQNFAESTMDNKALVGKYYLDNIKEYYSVVTRADNIAPPNAQTTEQELRKYTDKELIDYYRVNEDYTSRLALVQLAYNFRGRNEVRWSILHAYCSNKNIPNPLTLEPREAEPDDPVLSYGTDPVYRCYNVSELTAAIDLTDATFIDPDWKPGTNTEKFFPNDALQSLRKSLDTWLNVENQQVKKAQNLEVPLYTQLPALRNLHTKLKELLNANVLVSREIRKVRDTYQNILNADEQKVFRSYIAWLFLAGMVGRFWQGVGYPWPLKWTEGRSGEELEVCTDVQRDKTMIDFLFSHNGLLENYRQNFPHVLTMVENIYRVEIAFDLGKGQVFNRKVKDDINTALQSNFCLSHLATILVSTSIYYAQNVLGFTAIKPNGGITINTEQLTVLVNVEYLQLQPDEVQFPITIEGLRDTRHIDPGDVMRNIDEQGLTFNL